MRQNMFDESIITYFFENCNNFLDFIKIFVYNKKDMKIKLTFTAFVMTLVMLLTSCQARPHEPVQSVIGDYDYSQMQLVQLDAIAGQLREGQPIAIITTSHGVIRVALFPEYAPNTVANFIERAEEGFYNDSTVLAIQDSVFFQAGVNSSGEAHPAVLENEFSVNMWPFRGAIAAYGSNPGSSDSRFIIIDEQPLSEEEWEQLRTMLVDGENTLPDELLDAFEQHGVAVTLSGIFTVFGQTIEGIDAVQSIVSTDVDNIGRPRDEIRIISVEINYYESEGAGT
jgi:cyclophilin family peptidyl-prolyl cis-trans isomerase